MGLLSVGQEWSTLRSVGHFGPHYLVHTCPTLGFAVKFQRLLSMQTKTVYLVEYTLKNAYSDEHTLTNAYSDEHSLTNAYS